LHDSEEDMNHDENKNDDDSSEEDDHRIDDRNKVKFTRIMRFPGYVEDEENKSLIHILEKRDQCEKKVIILPISADFEIKKLEHFDP